MRSPQPISDIVIPLPCSMSWEQMNGEGDQRFCQGCKKHIVDFTGKDASALEKAKRKAVDGHVCGRFSSDQLSKDPKQLALGHWQLLKMRRFLACLIIVFGTALFNGLSAQDIDSVKNTSFSTVKVMVKDTTILQHDSVTTVSGSVVETNGTGIPFAMVGVFRDEHQVAAILTDPDGFYELRLAPGIYTIKAIYFSQVSQVVVTVGRTLLFAPDIVISPVILGTIGIVYTPPVIDILNPDMKTTFKGDWLERTTHP